MAAKRATRAGAVFDQNGRPISIGNRVEIGPSYDLWMMGAKYGEVRKIEAPDILVVRMDNTRVKGLRRFRASECTLVRARAPF